MPQENEPSQGSTSKPTFIERSRIRPYTSASTSASTSTSTSAIPPAANGTASDAAPLQPESESQPPTSPLQGRATIADAARSIKAQDFLAVHKTPCARDGFMTGIGAGAVVGAGRWIFGAPISKVSNWAVGTFLLGSIVRYEYCQWQRQQERAAMARVVEVLDRKQAEKRREKSEVEERATRIAAQEEEERAKARKSERSWYSFW